MFCKIFSDDSEIATDQKLGVHTLPSDRVGTTDGEGRRERAGAGTTAEVKQGRNR